MLRRPIARWRGRARTLEAIALVTAASAAQRWVPMQRWSIILGRHCPAPPAWSGSADHPLPRRPDSLTERQVSASVARATSLLGGAPSCLAQATAAQAMLRRRGSAGVVVIGLRPSNPEAPWDAHAWLLGRRGALTGGAAAQGFSAVTVFEVPGALRAEDVDLEVAS